MREVVGAGVRLCEKAGMISRIGTASRIPPRTRRAPAWATAVVVWATLALAAHGQNSAPVDGPTTPSSVAPGAVRSSATSPTLPTASIDELEYMQMAMASPGPRLVVLVTFDGFRADYLTRFSHQFKEDGFRRLMRDGYWAVDCRHDVGVTASAPGLATLSTGAYPHRSGIVADAWFDASSGRLRGAVEDSASRIVAARGVGAGRPGASGLNLESPTVGEGLRGVTAAKGKVVSLGMSDAGAVLLAGHAADLVLWWDPPSRQFVSSSAYGNSLPPWVLIHNESLRLRDYRPLTWTLYRPEAWYGLSREDDSPFETGFLGRTFPHTLDQDDANGGAAASQRFLATPLADEALADLAEKAIAAEALGRDEIPDLMCLSFASSGFIGRGFGPFSREMHDWVLRADALMARVLDMLDRRVGKNAYAILVVGTSGMAPVPEAMASEGIPAGRIEPGPLMEGAERHLRSHLGTRANPEDYPYLSAFASSRVWLNHESLRVHGVSVEAARSALRNYLERQEGIAAAYSTRTLADLQADGAERNSLAEALARSQYSGREGDVLVVPEPHWLITSTRTGAAPGSPYTYDQSVGLLAYGAGITDGVRNDEPVSATHVAPTIAALLRVAPPSQAESGSLPGALEEVKR